MTFRYSNDVIQAIEHGNDNVEPKYTLCFGGRRHFCKEAYADLGTVVKVLKSIWLIASLF